MSAISPPLFGDYLTGRRSSPRIKEAILLSGHVSYTNVCLCTLRLRTNMGPAGWTRGAANHRQVNIITQ